MSGKCSPLYAGGGFAVYSVAVAESFCAANKHSEVRRPDP